MRDDADFFKELRSEIAASQERRAAYTRQKFTFVVGFLGIGSISLQHIGTTTLLYIAPIIAFAFDLYLVGENFGIRRAGIFIRKSLNSSPEERVWEEAVELHRDWYSWLAGPIASLLVLLAAAFGIWRSQERSPLFWAWATAVGIGLISIWFLFDRTRYSKLKKFALYIDGKRTLLNAEQASQAKSAST